MALRKPCPEGRGQCRTCWRHAYDPDVCQRKPGDCATCKSHRDNGCPPGDIEP